MDPSSADLHERPYGQPVNGSNTSAGDVEAAALSQNLGEATTEPDQDPAELAANTRSDLELSLDLGPDSHTASDYWDASTMAPLNAVSAVSIA